MDLELILNWDKTIPFESFDEGLKPEDRDGIKISADVSNVGKTNDFKKRYEGFVSTMESATSYAFHIVYELLGERYRGDIERRQKNHIVSFHIVQYHLAEDGVRGLKLSSKRIEDISGLRSSLTDLERRWYIEPRNEEVNECDYWHGFFGTSNNLWNGSRYPRANPSERARQLAYDLEQGLRNIDERFWYFPGDIDKYPIESFSPQQIALIDGMNDIINNSSNMSKEKVIFGLKAHAQRYEKLV